jgi:hypothetical protein
MILMKHKTSFSRYLKNTKNQYEEFIMIRDRYDDTLDDPYDEEFILKFENRALEKKLAKLGVKFDPTIQNEDDSGLDPDDLILNKSMEIIALEVRNHYLKHILSDAEKKIR